MHLLTFSLPVMWLIILVVLALAEGHQDGLVHISQICDRFIRHPSEKLAVGDVVTVWVLEVDEKRCRISLTMKKPA